MLECLMPIVLVHLTFTYWTSFFLLELIQIGGETLLIDLPIRGI